jgi:RimJ/RimL family protein N-acetyltransferase
MNHFKSDSEIQSRPFSENDEAVIKNWPAYPPEFNELDYALREGGWIAEFRNQPGTRIYVAEQSGELVAFSLLSLTGQNEAEFRIALRADKFGRGLGRTITEKTLEMGFNEIGLKRIHLIVRKNNQRAIELYRRLNFLHCGECIKIINEGPTEFLKMEMFQNDFIGADCVGQ